MQAGFNKKIKILSQYPAFGSVTGGVRSRIHGRRCSSGSHLACPFTTQTATHQWILFITAAWTTALKRIVHNLIVCIEKSVAEVTNNRRLCSRYCTVETNY